MAIDVFAIRIHSPDLDVNMKSMLVNRVLARMVEHVLINRWDLDVNANLDLLVFNVKLKLMNVFLIHVLRLELNVVLIWIMHLNVNAMKDSVVNFVKQI